MFEAYGPGNIAIIIEGITDNRNRTLGEIKQILTQGGGKLVGEGAIRWMFERKGTIIINLKSPAFAEASAGKQTSKEELELMVIEAGADDIYWHDDMLDVYTKPEDLERVRKNLEDKGVKTDSVSLDWVSKEEVTADEPTKEACQKLFEALDENDAVQEIYSDLKL